MTHADELRKLQDLHTSGALTDDEFARAKARIQAKGELLRTEPDVPPPPAPIPLPNTRAARSASEDLKRRHALVALDKEWDAERAVLMSRSVFGSRNPPTRGMCIALATIGVFLLLVLALIALLTAGDNQARWFPFLVFGAAVALIDSYLVVHQYRLAGTFEQAQQRYDRKRRELGDTSPAWPDERDLISERML